MTNQELSKKEKFILADNLIQASKNGASFEEFRNALLPCLPFGQQVLWSNVFSKLRNRHGIEKTWPMIEILFEKTDFIGQEKSKNFIDFLLANASSIGNIQAVEYLLTSQKTKKYCNINYETDAPLMNAVTENHLDIVKFLCESEKIVDKADFKSNNSVAVRIAANRGYGELTGYLLSLYSETDFDGINAIAEKTHIRLIDQVFSSLSLAQKNYVVSDVCLRLKSLKNFPNVKSFIEKSTLTEALLDHMEKAPCRARAKI